MLLDEKTALITGAGSGIGKRASLLFAEEGARVIAADIDGEAAEDTVQNIRDRGNEAVSFQFDVSREVEVESAFESIKEKVSHLDILFNNAGIASQDTLATAEVSDYERVMGVSVKGTFLCSKYALPLLGPDDEDRITNIINMSSVAGVVGIGGMTTYCTAKSAVVGLTKSMSANLAPEIRVNCLAPGTTMTPLGESLLESDQSAEAQKRRMMKYPMDRFGEPEEIARAALFLAADQFSSFVTGVCLPVDGGMTSI